MVRDDTTKKDHLKEPVRGKISLHPSAEKAQFLYNVVNCNKLEACLFVSNTAFQRVVKMHTLTNQIKN